MLKKIWRFYVSLGNKGYVTPITRIHNHSGPNAGGPISAIAIIAVSVALSAGITAATANFSTSITVNGATAHSIPPQGSIILSSGTCPSGWTEYTTSRGRFIVGVPSGGTINGTAGVSPLTNLQDIDVTGIFKALQVTSPGTATGTTADLTKAAPETGIVPYVQLRFCVVP